MIEELRSDAAAGRFDLAAPKVQLLQEHARLAREAGTDPLWRSATAIPVIGDDISAVSEIAVSLDEVVTRAVVPLVSGFDQLDWASLAPEEKRIDLQPIVKVAPSLSTAAQAVELSHARLGSIDPSTLLPEVAGPLEEATDALEQASGALNSAAAAAELVPIMLGVDTPREYLLLIQNSAEVRATGGIPGAVAVVTADEGRVDLTAQGSAVALGRFNPPIIIDQQQEEIFSARMGGFLQSVNLTPDFPTAAETASKMWETRSEAASIDGVVALDPVALSYILSATGPVELTFEDPGVGEVLSASGLPTSLSADNVVDTLLSEVYAAIEDPQLQDAYFAAVAAEVFEAITSGTDQSDGMIESLIRSAEEGRLYVWSADEQEQDIIATTGLAGGVTGPSTGGASFGAYFNDGTGAKMDYYMRRTVQLERSCTPDGYQQYSLTATLTNTAPVDAAEALPAYVTGGGVFGVPPGTVQTNFVGYGPDRSQLQTAQIDGEPVPLGSYRHGKRPVGILTTNLAPGQTAIVEMNFTNVVQTSEPALDVTPTIQPTSEVILPLVEDKECG